LINDVFSCFHFLQTVTRANKVSAYIFPNWLVICFLPLKLRIGMFL